MDHENHRFEFTNNLRNIFILGEYYNNVKVL